MSHKKSEQKRKSMELNESDLSDYDDVELPPMQRMNALILIENPRNENILESQIRSPKIITDQCPICLDKKELVNILCGHSFCSEDLQILIQLARMKNDIIECSICRQLQRAKKQKQIWSISDDYKYYQMNQIKIQEVFQEQCWLCGKWLPKDEIKEHQSQCSNHFSKEDQEAYDEKIAMFFDQNKSTIFQTKKNLPIEEGIVEKKIGRMKIIEEKSQVHQFSNNLVETNLKKNDDSNNPKKPSQANFNQRQEQQISQQFIQQNEQQLKNVIRSSQNHSNSPARKDQSFQNNKNYFPIQEKKPFAGQYESQLISRKPLILQQEFDQKQQFKSEFIQKQVYLAKQHQQISQPNTFLKKPQNVNEMQIEEEAPQLEQKLPQVAYEKDYAAFKQQKQKEKQQIENEIKQYKYQNRDFQQNQKFSHPLYYQNRDYQYLGHNQPQNQIEKKEPQQVNNEVQNELILLQPPRLQQQPPQQLQQQQQVQQQPRKSYQPQKPGDRKINTANEQRRQYVPIHFRNEDRKRNLSDHQQHAPFKYQPGMKLTDAQVNKLTPEQLYEYFTSLDLENQVGYQSRIFNLQNKAAQIQKIETCSICMEDILPSKEKQDVKLDCNHCFHYVCIEQWLKLQKNCPVCKDKVVL